MLVRQIGLPLLARHHHQEVIGVVFIVAWAWLSPNRSADSAAGSRTRNPRRPPGTGSLLLLGERVLKAIFSIAAIFAILSSLGVNMTTALAGLGIGGIAIAFAAQKTLENLFGGVSLLGDEVIRVGDSAALVTRPERWKISAFAPLAFGPLTNRALHSQWLARYHEH